MRLCQLCLELSYFRRVILSRLLFNLIMLPSSRFLLEFKSLLWCLLLLFKIIWIKFFCNWIFICSTSPFFIGQCCFHGPMCWIKITAELLLLSRSLECNILDCLTRVSQASYNLFPIWINSLLWHHVEVVGTQLAIVLAN